MRAIAAAFALPAALAAQSFTLEQIRSYPFPTELTSSGSRLAWAANEQGRRNVYVAGAPDYTARRLTNYQHDDGQEITSLSISPDGRWVVFVRGGEHGSNWDRNAPVNPASLPAAFKVEIVSVPFDGGEARILAEGDQPVISPKSDQVVFPRQGALHVVPIDGAKPARPMFHARGTIADPQWSPDGTRLAFVSNRGTHSIVGVYSGDAAGIVWLSPATSFDASPRWSPDGAQIAFTRVPARGGEPASVLNPPPAPWSIRVANARTGESKQVWASGNARRDAMPSTDGGANLHWARNRITFVSYADGWPHLYSVPPDGGPATQLTKGRYMNEHISLSPEGAYLLASANTGPDPLDIDRRHILKVPVDRAAPEILTPGDGLEWKAAALADGLAFIAATTQNPPMVTVLRGGTRQTLAPAALPADFPTASLVTPKQVVFNAPDGTPIHAQLFEAKAGAAKKPAIVYVHGGPMRQMLLGWHYSDYYASAYALNQYLASRGFLVLSVNYRLGIGYGFDFHQPLDGGWRGASEYQDIRAAAEYLKRLPQVDAKRIGVYGGSYGGYLTALALARNSDLFAAGVDIHGVHNRFLGRSRLAYDGNYEKAPDADQAREIAWRSTPVADIATWKSPVLLIHGDDDRNVEFVQTVDLVRRLEKHNVPFEEIVIPDDTHHFLRHANATRVAAATADFLERKLK
jgi:dipeptidyl aminopeptidase/acylaminoacyl peptidase